jgi:iron(III) transport system substrate-binding protein
MLLYRCTILSLCCCFLLTGALLAQTLTLYSGRSRPLVEPMIQAFERETGIRVQVRYGGTPQLALALQEEGRRSRADLFWGQDAGALEALKARGLLAELAPEVAPDLYPGFRDPEGFWVASSSRARVLVYSPLRVAEADLPTTLNELINNRWNQRIGWAPANGSFQAFLGAWLTMEGEGAVSPWLTAMRQLRPRAYPNNNAILEAVAAGEIDVGLTNHYYLFRQLERNPDFPVAQVFFEAGSPGNLLNFAALGVSAFSRNKDAAGQFINFMLSEKAQAYFANVVYEYPVKPVEVLIEGLKPFDELMEIVPEIRPVDFTSLEQTLDLLRRAGLL